MLLAAAGYGTNLSELNALGLQRLKSKSSASAHISGALYGSISQFNNAVFNAVLFGKMRVEID